MSDRLSWPRDGADWPNKHCSAFIDAADITWHVQRCGKGPKMLMLHGTGASTHSWRDLLPILSTSFEICAPDLPGHGFTQTPRSWRLSLAGMSQDTAALLEEIDFHPDIVVGHSAGAAILAQMIMDGLIKPAGLISLNGALVKLTDARGDFFSPIAKALTFVPYVPRVFATLAGNRRFVDRLLDETGSQIDERGKELYTRLVASPAHVSAALDMMSNWDLERFAKDLPSLKCPTFLITGANDQTVPAEDSRRAGKLIPSSEVKILDGLGHLAHEEAPNLIARLIRDQAEKWGILAKGKSSSSKVVDPP